MEKESDQVHETERKSKCKTYKDMVAGRISGGNTADTAPWQLLFHR